jgi:hypothetical protein
MRSHHCSLRDRGVAQRRGGRSGSSAFIMMIQTADLRRFDNCTVGVRLYSSCVRGVFVQQQVSSPTMIIGTISREHATKRALLEHNHVIKTFATNRADEPFHIMQFAGRHHIPAECFHQGCQQAARTPDPVRQSRTLQLQAGPGIDCRLPVQRYVITVLGDQDMRQQTRTR